MAFVEPVTLSRDGITLEPLGFQHEAGLAAAAQADDLWRIEVSMVPGAGEERDYIELALAQKDRFAFAVLDADGTVLGSTSYHDITPGPRRVEIGYTFYAKRVQRTHVNTTCKLLLLGHAFGPLGCSVVGWRTDGENFASQAAIERLGAKKDGVIRRHSLRRDGVTIRDTVMFSMLAEEWPAARERLEARLAAGAVGTSSETPDARAESTTAGPAVITGSQTTAPATTAPDRSGAGLGATIPGLPVRDMVTAVAFYEAQFGFDTLHCDAGFAVLRRDGAVIHLWQSADERWRSRADVAERPVVSGAESFLAGTSGTRIETVDVDGLFAELEPRGVLHPNSPRITDTDFGTREFPTLDADGNLLTFFRWRR